MDVATTNTLSLVNSGTKTLLAATGSHQVTAQTDLITASEQAQTGIEADASAQTVEQAASSIQSYVQSIRRDLNFAVDDSSGRVVVKVTDSTSGDVIRQIPSEDALKLAENLDAVRSLLFRAEA
ncbi:Flagellar biosynthesis protein FlaG [Pseudomonas marincola]|uniref:Flagellar biosynthesis protein FlaG n=1 Tax=Pseudomonas marincola TaxID=437900 RepID=A0A1I7AY59_9PSED|nr:flagellar protein FlaG [Pseudomonas marincola]CAE6908245.1 Flagellar biosynthesis protein FlaG [Pseudomonas marincola]SFT79813.1 flagellar protein FlaG [Pseudomonas marincola]